MKHFGEKVNLWVQYRCSLSHTPFSCSVTDSLLWRFPCHCIHTYISLRPHPPPPPPPPPPPRLPWKKKKRNPHASTSHFPGFLVTKASLFRGTSTGRLAPRQRHTLGRLQKRAPPPPNPHAGQVVRASASQYDSLVWVPLWPLAGFPVVLSHSRVHILGHAW